MRYIKGVNPCIGGTRDFSLAVSISGTTSANYSWSGGHINRSATVSYDDTFYGNFDWTAKDCSCDKDYTGSESWSFNLPYIWEVDLDDGGDCDGIHNGTTNKTVSLSIAPQYDGDDLTGFLVSFGEGNNVAMGFPCGDFNRLYDAYSVAGGACCESVPCPGYSVTLPPEGGEGEIEISCSGVIDLGGATITVNATVTVTLEWL